MRRVIGVLALAALGVAGFSGALFATSGQATTSGKAGPNASEKTSRVTVTATEFRFRLSKRTVPTGTVIFTVVNRGRITHDFRIAGKKTRVLQPGQRATLRVKISKKGRYRYICTLLGHASAGMKGVLAIGTTPPPTTSTRTTSTTTTTTTTTTSTTTTTVPGPATTVQVGMFEYRFELTPPSVPAGTVTFVITNRGQEVHNFAITGVKSGAIIGPGQTETWTVGLAAGTYGYVCDVPFHAENGMRGSLVVSPS
jgi:plastocyanin